MNDYPTSLSVWEGRRHVESPRCTDLAAEKGQNMCLGACLQSPLLLQRTALLVSTAQGCLVCTSPFSGGSDLHQRIPFINLTKPSWSLNLASPRYKGVPSHVSLFPLLSKDFQYAMEAGCFLTLLPPNGGHCGASEFLILPWKTVVLLGTTFSATRYGPWHSAGSVYNESVLCHRAESQGKEWRQVLTGDTHTQSGARASIRSVWK